MRFPAIWKLILNPMAQERRKKVHTPFLLASPSPPWPLTTETAELEAGEACPPPLFAADKIAYFRAWRTWAVRLPNSAKLQKLQLDVNAQITQNRISEFLVFKLLPAPLALEP